MAMFEDDYERRFMFKEMFEITWLLILYFKHEFQKYFIMLTDVWLIAFTDNLYPNFKNISTFKSNN